MTACLAHRSRLHRHLVCVATVLFGLMVGGNLANLFHFATVAHTHCVEHGDLIHGAHDHTVDAPAAPAEAGVGALSALPAGEAGHTHDACTWCMTERVRVLRPTPAPVPEWQVFARAGEPRAPPAAVVQAPGAPLYLIAPKQSPPA